MLRSKIRDLSTTNPDWSDGDLNILLLHSAWHVQDIVNLIDPNPYTTIKYNDLVAGQYLYALPNNYRSPGVREVAIKSGDSYVPIRRYEAVKADEVRAGTTLPNASEGIRYAISFGQLEIIPTPTSNIVDGIRMVFSTTIAMDDDDAVPQLPLSLHPCIYLDAAMMIAPDSDDPAFDQYDKLMKRYTDAYHASFKVVNNLDVPAIEGVGGNDRMSWGSIIPIGDTTQPRRI
jgi:hypothetical protein